MKQFELDKAAVEAAAQREDNLARFREWMIAHHPEIKFPSIAVEKLFEEYLDFSERPLTNADFAFSFSNLESKIYGRQHVATADEIRAQLIEKICDLIASKNGGKDGKFDSYQLKSERIKMEFWSITELVNRLEEVMRRQTLASKPLTELHQIARGNKEERPYIGFATLASSIVPRGQIIAVSTREYLNQIAKADIHAFKKMVEVYGSKQVDDIRFGRRYGN
jgi:hypothetical protein